MSTDKEHIENLILRSLTGEASEQEESELKNWRAESADNEEYYAETARILSLGANQLTRRQKKIEIDLESEWSAFKDNIQAKGEPERARLGNVVSFTFLRIAAGISMLALVAWALYYFTSTGQTTTLIADNNWKEFELPDHSIITLNKNSQLSFNQDFNDNIREVFLKGEAFFSVSPNKEKPFIIHANNSIIQVLGTSFNVNAYTSQENLEVVVETGLVKFQVPDVKKEIILKPGQKGIYVRKSNELEFRSNEDPNYLSWKTRHIIFDKTTLSKVIRTLNKVYGSQIELGPDVSGDCEVTVTFDHQDLESVLNVLQATLHLTLSTRENKTIITEAGC